MSASATPLDAKRRRQLVTPEGVPLDVTLATRGSRLLALVLDYTIIMLTLILAFVGLLMIGINLETAGAIDDGAGEFLIVLFVIFVFVLFNGYFILMEMGPRGATWGKRMVGIRVAARPQGQSGERLTAEAIIARNLLRQVEIFLPLTFFQSAGDGGGTAWIAGSLWFATFMLFPFFNKDALRAGDVIAGTWVVEAPRRKLGDVLSLASGEAAVAAQPSYRFGEEELSVYGEYELQSLERVLRDGDDKTLEAVHQAIVRKIGWQAGSGDEREFLEAFYTALRARLEGGMRLGQRKADKHSEIDRAGTRLG